MVAKVCSRSQGQPSFGSRRRAMMAAGRKIGWRSSSAGGGAVAGGAGAGMGIAGRGGTTLYRSFAKLWHAARMPHPRLFHFSEDAAIEVFEPRPVTVAAERRPG